MIPEKGQLQKEPRPTYFSRNFVALRSELHNVPSFRLLECLCDPPCSAGIVDEK
jgi:hypothetical protein